MASFCLLCCPHLPSITEFLTMSTITSQNKGLTNVQLQQTIDHIDAHLDRDLSLEQIAAVINVSPNYFASLFKQATGTSPHQYVIRQRVKRAEVMLSKTNWAIADIALQAR
jgi:AraC family transcriptional regulator